MSDLPEPPRPPARPQPQTLPLLAVPNISEGRNGAALEAVAAAFTREGGARLLDRHSDADHHRAVFTLAGAPGELAGALVAGAREALRLVDLGAREEAEVGRHPHVGAVDVMPVVYLDAGMRGAACAEALVVADRIGGELEVPVFLYGELTGAAGRPGRARAELRRGGREGLAARMAAGEERPDFGPAALHPTAGATLVAAREPLVAFNLELAPPATVADARRIAALIREGGEEGLPGLRAIGVELSGRTAGPSPERRDRIPVAGGPGTGAVAQVSLNVERPLQVPLRAVVEAVRRHAEVLAAELVGLAPQAALEGFPADLPMPGFDAGSRTIEKVLEGGAVAQGPASRAPRFSG